MENFKNYKSVFPIKKEKKDFNMSLYPTPLDNPVSTVIISVIRYILEKSRKGK